MLTAVVTIMLLVVGRLWPILCDADDHEVPEKRRSHAPMMTATDRGTGCGRLPAWHQWVGDAVECGPHQRDAQIG